MGEKIYNGFAVLPLVEEERREDTNLFEPFALLCPHVCTFIDSADFEDIMRAMMALLGCTRLRY